MSAAVIRLRYAASNNPLEGLTLGSMSIWHWIIVLVVVILVFGTKKLPSLGQDLGKAIRGFKKSMGDEDSPRLEADAKSEQAEKPAAKDRVE